MSLSSAFRGFNSKATKILVGAQLVLPNERTQKAAVETSKSVSRRAILLSPLVLAACGFRPIYGRGSAAEVLKGKIVLGTVSDRLSFEFYEQLENRLGSAESPLFKLDVSLTVSSEGLAITQDNAVTRYNLTGEASFSLTRIDDGAVVLQDTLRAFTAYSATASAYATFVSERDANRRLAVSLADQIAIRIASSAESYGL